MDFKKNIRGFFVSIAFLMLCYNTYSIHKINKELNNNSIAMSKLEVGMSGKIQDLSSKTDKIVKQHQSAVIRKEISYVEKSSKDDADIELNSSRPKISIKVNDGPKYYLDTLPNETTKLENGKLIINQRFGTDINIKADEYKMSRWHLTTALNADKKVMGGITYDLGNTVSVSAFIGQGIKPYYGLTYKIGGRE